MNKYHETMIKSFHDAMESLTLQEREEYDRIHNREQDFHMWQQAIDDEQEQESELR